MNNNEENKIVYLRLDDILPNRFQPREVFDETGLEELSSSIKEHGVIQPIIVRQVGDKYELIAGERRSKASAMAGLTTIPAIIKNMDDKESAKVSLLENLQRKNLSAIEEARTYKRILELDNLTQEDLAKTMGKSQPMIANKLRLLALPEEIQDALIKNQISERHARSLLNVKDKENQLMLLERIKKERLTVRELDVEIKKVLEDNNISNGGNAMDNFDQMNSQNLNNFNGNNPFNAQGTMNYFNNQDDDNSGARQSFNNFGGSFNNMGLDDYRTSVGNNMFSNVPNENQKNKFNNFSNMPNVADNNQFSNFSNMPSIESNETPLLNSKEDSLKPFNPKQEEEKDNYSLGSMLDENQGSNINKDILNQEKDTDKNFFVSNIRENTQKPAENQFLPNFDLNQPMNNSFSNNQNIDYQSNFSNNMNDFTNNEFNDFNQGMSNNNDFTNFNNFTDMQPIVENNLNNPVNNFQDNFAMNNQGDLFNQPLNIVNIPNNNLKEEVNINSNHSNLDEEKPLNESIDNPFDDSYENILFAKPVPVKEENELEGTTNSNLSTENKNDFEQTTDNDKSKYIDLEPVRTIFDARGAVLELKKTTDRIKNEGIPLESEEIDYDDYYQIIIKIKKN